MPDITAAEVLDLRTHLLQQVWARAHTKWRTTKQLYDRQHPIRVPKGASYKKFYLNIGRAKVQATVDTLVTDKPKVHREPIAEGKEHEALATEVEKGAQGLMWRLGRGAGSHPPFKRMAFNITLYGYTTYGLRWNNQAWPKKPEEGSQAEIEAWEQQRRWAFPFALMVPHPARILLPPFEREPCYAIETATMQAGEVIADYPELAGRFHGDSRRQVEVIYYCDLDTRALLVDKDLVWQKVSKLGFVPYGYAYSGWGDEDSPVYDAPVEGMSLGANPADFAVGLLDNLVDSITALDELFTGRMVLELETEYRQEFITGPAAQETAQMLAEAGPGAKVPLPPGTEVKWKEPPRIDPALLQAEAIARQDIEQGTFSGVVQGERAAGVTTATQHFGMLMAARQKFDVPMQQLNYLGGIILGQCARMIEAREETVVVDGVRLTGEKFEGNYDFEVNFIAKDEATQLRAKASAMDEKKADLIDTGTYHEEAGRENGSEIMDAVWLERASNAPQVMDSILEAADAAFRQKHGLPPRQPAPMPVPGETPAGFTALPGGPQEAAQVNRGMAQVPGQDMERVIPG